MAHGSGDNECKNKGSEADHSRRGHRDRQRECIIKRSGGHQSDLKDPSISPRPPGAKTASWRQEFPFRDQSGNVTQIHKCMCVCVCTLKQGGNRLHPLHWSLSGGGGGTGMGGFPLGPQLEQRKTQRGVFPLRGPSLGEEVGGPDTLGIIRLR